MEDLNAERERAREKAEKEAAAAALLEKLSKRATVITNALRKFVQSWTTAHDLEQAAAREAAARKAMKGKKGKKKGKAESQKESKKDSGAKDGKKKAVKPPVAEAWSNFMQALDELANKQKRINMEDLYRGVERLEAPERVCLARIIATANKKVLPTESMNLNQLALKEALFSAVSAHDYSLDRTAAGLAGGSNLGLHALRDQGAPAHIVAEQGFRPADLFKVGYSAADVVSAAQGDAAKLRAAGVSVEDVRLAGVPHELQGVAGLVRMRAAGYSASELLQAGSAAPWALRCAGYSAADLTSAGVSVEELRVAGYGHPALQPPQPLAEAFSKLQAYDPRDLPDIQLGTLHPLWAKVVPQGVRAETRQAAL